MHIKNNSIILLKKEYVRIIYYPIIGKPQAVYAKYEICTEQNVNVIRSNRESIGNKTSVIVWSISV